jgi:hypothetical protein
MCFSAEASFAASAALGVIGVTGLARGPAPAERPLAFIPLLFAAQQFVEGLVWVGLANHEDAVVAVFGHVYIFFAFFLWPVFVPLAALLIEPSAPRRRLQEWLCAAGACAAVFITGSLVRGPLSVEATTGHLFYGLALPLREEVVAVYLLAVSAPIASSQRWVRVFGVALAIGLGASLAHFADDFVSLWCFAAAIASGAIWLHVRESAGARSALGTLRAPDLAP